MVAAANTGVGQMPSFLKANIPRPSLFGGARNVREKDNFLWGLETYFRTMGITDESHKVSHASLFLKYIALVWWRRRCDDVKIGSEPVQTWDEFKRGLKKQFYPRMKPGPNSTAFNTKEGHIRECVQEFQELLLEILDMSEKAALFIFLDGLCDWTKTELKRQRVQDLAFTVAAAKSLVEYKKESSTGPVKKSTHSGKGGGEHDHAPKKDKPTHFYDKG